MKIKAFFDIVGSVLKDWHVILTIVAMLFVMWAANFIIKYKKKPRKAKKGKVAKPEAPKEAAPAKPAEEKKEDE